ncbi:MAG: hypothetical protein AAFP86_20680, partial [Planctomycetota bacterium]
QDVSNLAAAAGVEWAPIEPLVFDPAPEVVGGGRIARKWSEWSTRGERRRAASERIRASLRPFEALLEGGAFDLVLADVELAEHVFAMAAGGQRFALLTPWFETQKRPGLPPITSDVTPGVGFSGSLVGIETRWLRERTWRRLRRALVWARYFGTDRRSVLVEHALSAGVPRRALRPDDWVTDFGMEGMPTLRLTLPSLEFAHRPRPEVEVVGPMVLPQELRGGGAPALARFRARMQELLDGSRSVHYVAASSKSRVAGEFLARVVRATAEQEGHFVVGAGGDRRAYELCVEARERGGRVDVEFDAPGEAAMEHAGLALHHGGIHTVNEAIVHGVRQLVYSGREADQDGVTARLVQRGLAHSGSRDESEQQICNRMERAYGDAALGERAQVARVEAE